MSGCVHLLSEVATVASLRGAGGSPVLWFVPVSCRGGGVAVAGETRVHPGGSRPADTEDKTAHDKTSVGLLSSDNKGMTPKTE